MTTTATIETGTFEGKTAQEWLAEGRGHQAKESESFARCEEDGFMSQKVSAQHAHMCTLKAELAENGAWTEVDAIFDLDGNLIYAELGWNDFGAYWYAPATERGQRGAYYNESKARNEATRKANNAKKGFQLGRIQVPATVEFRSGGTGMAGAFSGAYQIVRTSKKIDPKQVRIVDNGSN